MHDAEKFPLSVNLDLAPQTESPQPQRAADVGKDRFDNAESSAVLASTLRGIDLLFHLVRVGLRRIGCPTREEHHLSRQRALRVT